MGHELGFYRVLPSFFSRFTEIERFIVALNRCCLGWDQIYWVLLGFRNTSNRSKDIEETLDLQQTGALFVSSKQKKQKWRNKQLKTGVGGEKKRLS